MGAVKAEKERRRTSWRRSRVYRRIRCWIVKTVKEISGIPAGSQLRWRARILTCRIPPVAQAELAPIAPTRKKSKWLSNDFFLHIFIFFYFQQSYSLFFHYMWQSLWALLYLAWPVSLTCLDLRNKCFSLLEPSGGHFDKDFFFNIHFYGHFYRNRTKTNLIQA